MTPKKRNESERGPEEGSSEWYDALSYGEKMKLVGELASAVLQERKDVRDPYAHKRYGTSRDSAVQRLAAIKLHEMKVVNKMSFREIADILDVSYERVRQLYGKFYPDPEGDDDERAKEASA